MWLIHNDKIADNSMIEEKIPIWFDLQYEIPLVKYKV